LKAIWKVVIYILAISPSKYLDRAMAAMEGTANVPASGMGATLMQLRRWRPHRMVEQFMEEICKTTPRFDIKTTFVDITKLDAVEAAITQIRNRK
jgi:methionine-gamma-lyase